MLMKIMMMMTTMMMIMISYHASEPDVEAVAMPTFLILVPATISDTLPVFDINSFRRDVDSPSAQTPGSFREGGILVFPPVASVFNIVQELCESRGGRPGLSVLTSLIVS